MTALLIVIIVYVWCAVGHLILALSRWGYPENFRCLDLLFWPNRTWFTACNLIHDWRVDLYRRTKHY